jgi:hypothetical protein
MRFLAFAAAVAVGVMAFPDAGTAQKAQKGKRELIWVAGKVASITVQQPTTVWANVGGKSVRLCHPVDGRDIQINATYMHYDILRSALLAGKKVQVGVYDLGFDPQSGMAKLCVDRILLEQ